MVQELIPEFINCHQPIRTPQGSWLELIVEEDEGEHEGYTCIPDCDVYRGKHHHHFIQFSTLPLLRNCGFATQNLHVNRVKTSSKQGEEFQPYHLQSAKISMNIFIIFPYVTNFFEALNFTWDQTTTREKPRCEFCIILPEFGTFVTYGHLLSLFRSEEYPISSAPNSGA